MVEISDEYIRQMLARMGEYLIVILLEGPEWNKPGKDVLV